ncbi:MAG: hypothetical protein N5P05_003515 [Chroococcopsis gigantea SAG 12.99]|jgi:hypothetical protein|nr:hypothetical protein [Chlorogloea purpurea SAG 13.99]MDV3001909.1 hypothetical protein [Chroococcopsis gigantea SAG 12.99]
MRYPRWKCFQGGLLGGFLGESLQVSTGRDYLNYGLIPHTQFVQKWLNNLCAERPENNILIVSEQEYILSIFPLILRWHDQPSYWRQQLIIMGNSSHICAEVQEIGLLWGSVLSFILLEQVNPKEILTSLLNNIDGKCNNLLLIKELIESGCSYKTGCKKLLKLKLKQVEVMLALYGFILTPDDVRLCLCRAGGGKNERYFTAYLTGTILGLYNSIGGVPLSWRVQIEDHPTVKKLFDQAGELYRVWCGMYGELSLDAAVASPGIIQPRGGVKVISQRES